MDEKGQNDPEIKIPSDIESLIETLKDQEEQRRRAIEMAIDKLNEVSDPETIIDILSLAHSMMEIHQDMVRRYPTLFEAEDK